MKQIWAPWRMEYILGDKSNDCIFCHNLSVKQSKKKLILYHGKFSLVMLNRYPYTNCHLLVAPGKHTDTLEGLTREESLNFFLTLRKSVSILKKAIKPDGFNIGMNLGRIAGAGVAGGAVAAAADASKAGRWEHRGGVCVDGGDGGVRGGDEGGVGRINRNCIAPYSDCLL